MKNPIFTLLATASLLTATPVLAMDEKDPLVNVQAKVRQLTQSETKSSKKGVTGLPLGSTMRPKVLQDWLPLGLLKTELIPVTPGYKLTANCVFAAPATEGTVIAFLNTAQNDYYPGGIHVQPEETKATFSSFIPTGETQTCLVIRNPAFDNATSLPLGIQLSSLTIQSEDILPSIGTRKKFKPKELIQDWKTFGLLKTNAIPVKPGQRLTVNCELDVLTKTAISFINSAENDYYEGGVVVDTPGKQMLSFFSVVPDNQKQTWLVFRDPSFDGRTERTLGVVVHKVFIDVD